MSSSRATWRNVVKNVVKRLNGSLMKLGFDTANDRIFGSASFAPSRVLMCREKKASSKKGAAGEDAEPEPEADAA